MARDVDKLGKLLGKRTSTATVGVVQAVQGERLRVRTSTGVKYVAKTGSSSYRKGDKVSISGGMVTGKVKAVSGYTPVYVV